MNLKQAKNLLRENGYKLYKKEILVTDINLLLL